MKLTINRMRGLLLLLMAVFSLQIMAQSLPSKISDGVILHCFNWKYNDIKNSLSQIKAAGFVAVQTSPAQLNVTNQDNWNILYRPRDSKAGPNVLGTSSDLKALCDAAHALGIKVIVDVVANHTDGSLDWVADYWKNTDLYHDNGWANDGSRFQATHGSIGMRDLKTEDSRVQQKFKAYVQELKGLGVDGCRWDAAKHIGLPSEGDNFWKVVLDQSMYNYGEILNTCGGDKNTHKNCLKEYTSYMSVTDNVYSTNNVLSAFKGGGVPQTPGCWTFDTSNSNFVYWGESHDTYCNDGDASDGVNQNVIDRAYAVAASHNAIPALYLSRPNGRGSSCQAGVKGSTHFTSKEVAEVNKFHNAMAGKADYYSAGNGACSTTRKGGGAVIVKGSGSGQVSVPNGGGYAEAGTYTDRVSGGTFTVTSTTISGNVGSSGIAVLWKDSQSSTGGGDDPTPEPDPVKLPSCATVQSGTYCYFETSWTGVNVWAWTGETNLYSAWPGSAEHLTKVGTNNGNDVYLWKYSGAEPSNIIFNADGGSTQTDDFSFTNGGYYNESGLVGIVSGTTPSPDPNPNPDPEPIPMGTTIYVKASAAPYLYVWAGEPAVELNGAWPGSQMTQKSGEYWMASFTEEPVNIIFNNGNGGQTDDISGISGANYFTYDGNSGFTKESGSGGGGGGNTSDLPSCATYVENSPFCYLEASWSSANVWAWIDGADGSEYVGTAWPGVAMTQVGTNNGKTVFRWVSTKSTAPDHIIFNNGADQTTDLTFTNGGYYNEGGTLVGTVKNTTGIDALFANGQQTVNVYTIDGRQLRRNVAVSTAVAGLEKGIYIVNGKKIAVR